METHYPINRNVNDPEHVIDTDYSEPSFWTLFATAFLIFAVFAVVFFVACGTAHAYSNDEICNAIYKAENSKSHPYGILKHYKHTTPRQACLNTVAHAKRDWNGNGDFLAFLACRYAPIGCSNDTRGLNSNWLKNVRHFLRKAVLS